MAAKLNFLRRLPMQLGIAFLLLVIALLYYNLNLPPHVRGTVSLEAGETAVWPADNRLVLQIEETSGSVIAETILEDVQLPVDFKISYDAESIDQAAAYILAARVSDSQDETLFVGQENYQVATDNDSLNIDVILIAAVADTEASPLPDQAAEEAEDEPEWISGNVNLEIDGALPEDALLSIKLRQEGIEEEGQFLAEAVLQADAWPLAFRLPYDMDNIRQDLGYILDAQIKDSEDNVLFVSKGTYAVLTQGHPSSEIEIELTAAP